MIRLFSIIILFFSRDPWRVIEFYCTRLLNIIYLFMVYLVTL
jgi:hypothetical protein